MTPKRYQMLPVRKRPSRAHALRPGFCARCERWAMQTYAYHGLSKKRLCRSCSVERIAASGRVR